MHRGPIRLMGLAAEAGAVIVPPVPMFYHLPRTSEDLVNRTVGCLLDQAGIDGPAAKRWGEEKGTVAPASGSQAGGSKK
ncbi:hypothetical protein REC12_23360 [Desulfosporosinus sp. PR]|uniref:hypothetical protein n=1 Tax=Candidatus Desulfosporosinus nitrosoreducens TaxID=3401928 RepID=UPI0027F23CBE|nr:hypothetical protein [Desulfosporosinus sp. PR]MDQ7096539.1 hypothetical protein [Desulfosporosinus sp. PR]